jgi:hypothetical protein
MPPCRKRRASSTIALLGDRAGWLDRALPRISLEGDEHRPAAPPGVPATEAA